jgi:ABC-type cobalamin/Fe3+-siderophores transport system ATPase subunit
MDTPVGETSNSVPQSLLVQFHRKTERRHIWLMIGPAGCGKSTIGNYVAKILNIPFLEGDNVSLVKQHSAWFLSYALV